MSTNRFRRIDRRTAEQLLRGAAVDGQAGDPATALGDLLAAAAAPARSGEQAGEQVAMAAFRSAQLAPAPQSRRRSMFTTKLAGLLSAKFLAAGAAAAAVSGVAVAATTGTLDIPSDPPGAPPTSHATSTARPSSTPAGKSGEHPTPSLVGLCQAYTAGAGSEHGDALSSPAFEYLTTSAQTCSPTGRASSPTTPSPRHRRTRQPTPRPRRAATTTPPARPPMSPVTATITPPGHRRTSPASSCYSKASSGRSPNAFPGRRRNIWGCGNRVTRVTVGTPRLREPA